MNTEDVLSEIKFLELSNPIKYNKYKNQLSAYKRNLATFQFRHSQNIGNYSSDIALCKETITVMTEVIEYYNQHKENKSKNLLK